jgi:hypothetical protein
VPAPRIKVLIKHLKLRLRLYINERRGILKISWFETGLRGGT